MANIVRQIERIEEAKTDIENAIEEIIGDVIPEDALLDDYAEYIRTIPSTVLGSLNVDSVGGSGSYIESIKQENGKIVPTSKQLPAGCSKLGTVTEITLGTGLSTSTGVSSITESGTINLVEATTTSLGGIKLGYTQSGKYYPVQINSRNLAYVYVPWDDNTWRGITDSFTGTATDISLSQKGANSLYNTFISDLEDTLADNFAISGGGNTWGSSLSVTINGTTQTLTIPSNPNSHWTTRIYAGASGTATNDAVANPYLKVTDNNTYRNLVRLIGNGSTTVNSDANGNITISSTGTTYNVFGKTIDANFKTAYRTLTKGDETQGYYISAIRNDKPSVDSSPRYGTGLAFGMADTHGYLYMDYLTAQAWLGAGNDNELLWVKKLAFADGTGASGTWDIDISGNADTLDNFHASDLLTALSSSITNAVSITVGGTTKNITAATLKTSLGLGSNAYSSTAYLPLAGGTMTGCITASTGNHAGIKVGNTYLTARDGNLVLQNNSAIRFGGDSWDYNVWAGLKYAHSSKTIYLGLADGTQFTATSSQSGGKICLPGIDDLYIGNGVYQVFHSGSNAVPWSDNKGSLGEDTIRWKTVYAYTMYAKTAFYQSSDITLKTNIQNLSKDLLNKVYNINEVSFNWKKSGEKAFGYIAQDYENVSEIFVSKDSNGILSLDYTKVLVAQIAALKAKIETLETRLKILES